MHTEHKCIQAGQSEELELSWEEDCELLYQFSCGMGSSGAQARLGLCVFQFICDIFMAHFWLFALGDGVQCGARYICALS